MPERSFHWPEGHWDWINHLANKHGVRCGELIFVGGQVDKDAEGERLHLYDLPTQTGVVVRHIETVLAGFGAGLADVTKLVAFYVNDGSVDEQAFLADVGRHLIEGGGAPDGVGPAITAVPLPWLAYPGMMVEIEAIAMRGDGGYLIRKAANPEGLGPLPAPFSHGLCCGEHIWVGGQGPCTVDGMARHAGDIVAQAPAVMEKLRTVLVALGSDLEDAMKFNVWYAGDGTLATLQEAAQRRATFFTAPGPAATALPTPSLPAGETTRVELWAMRGTDGARLAKQPVRPNGHWDWPVPMPYSMGVKCGDMVFVGGQVPLDDKGEVMDRGDLDAQTRRTMAYIGGVLDEFGLTMDEMVKQNAFYKGDAGPEVIVPNQTLRSSYYTEPAGASTGVPLPFLSVEDLMVEVEIIAMTR